MFNRVPFRQLVTPLLVAGALAVVHIPDVRAARGYGRVTGVVHLVALAGTPLRSGACRSATTTSRTGERDEEQDVILYSTQKFLFHMNRDPAVQRRYKDDLPA